MYGAIKRVATIPTNVYHSDPFGVYQKNPLMCHGIWFSCHNLVASFYNEDVFLSQIPQLPSMNNFEFFARVNIQFHVLR